MKDIIFKIIFPKEYRANKRIPRILDCVLEWNKRAESIAGTEGYELKRCTEDLITKLINIYN